MKWVCGSDVNSRVVKKASPYPTGKIYNCRIGAKYFSPGNSSSPQKALPPAR